MTKVGLALVLTLGLGLGLACKPKEAEPVAVARMFADTARRGDVQGMLALIEQAAVERVTEAAETASDQVGGRRAIEASEMLQIVGVDRTVAVAEAELIDDDGELAHVELTMTDGRRLRLELVWEQAIAGDEHNEARAGGWKVRIPLPASAIEGPSELPQGQPDA
ncbi:MAG TPA: hypothetical protein VM869_24595 [Enhygromyxa sp.]|nr:hypothetical protein [Enhygromyxa sp.]